MSEWKKCPTLLCERCMRAFEEGNMICVPLRDAYKGEMCCNCKKPAKYSYDLFSKRKMKEFLDANS